MAYYCFLNENNIVVMVCPGKDEGESGINWEQYYAESSGMMCKQTSYNTRGGRHYSSVTNEPDNGTPFRKNYAGIGYTYDAVRDAFIPQKPYPSWLLNEDTCLWEAPTPYPTDEKQYTWDEATTSWIEVT
jgi:hypothetical protein